MRIGKRCPATSKGTCPGREGPRNNLRIRRLGVRVPPSAPLFSQVIALTAHHSPRRSGHLAGSWPDQQVRRRGQLPGPVSVAITRVYAALQAGARLCQEDHPVADCRRSRAHGRSPAGTAQPSVAVGVWSSVIQQSPASRVSSSLDGGRPRPRTTTWVRGRLALGRHDSGVKSRRPGETAATPLRHRGDRPC